MLANRTRTPNDGKTDVDGRTQSGTYVLTTRRHAGACRYRVQVGSPPSIRLDTSSGVSADLSVVRDVLASQRRRVVIELESLQPPEWAHPSRCQLWTVQDVARHLVDTSRIHAARLRGDPPVFPRHGPFDEQLTPRQWLKRSEGQSAHETLWALDRAVASELAAVDARIEPWLSATSNSMKVHVKGWLADSSPASAREILRTVRGTASSGASFRRLSASTVPMNDTPTPSRSRTAHFLS